MPSKKSIVARLTKGAFWVTAGRGFDLLFVMAANFLVARTLSKEDFGNVLVQFNLIALLSICGTMGLNRSIVKYIASYVASNSHAHLREMLRHVVPVVVFASLLSMLPAIVWSLLIAKQSWSIVTAVCLSIPLRAVLRIVAEGLRGFHDLKTASAFATQNAGQAAGPVIDLMFLIVLFAMRGATDLSLTVVLWANVAAIAVCLPLPLWALRMRVAALPGDAIGLPSPSLGPLPTRRFIIYDSLAVLISQVCSFAAWYADNFIAKFVLSPDDFGLYTSARYLITTVILPLSLMNMSVISLIPEMMTRGEKSQLEKVLRTSSFVASLPSIIAIILMCFFANLVMSVAFSSSYAAGGPVLAIMALGRLVNAVTATASFVLMMTGNEKIQIILCILATLAMCVAGPIAAWAGGLIAYAVSIAVVFSLFCASLELAVRRSTGIWTHAQIPAFLKRRTA